MAATALKRSSRSFVPSAPSIIVTKSVLVFCPKGGVGKTTVSRGLAVSAAREGHRVLVIDFDADQGTFTKWFQKRLGHPLSSSSFDCIPGDFCRWRQIWNEAQTYDWVIIDSPPGIQGKEAVIYEMSETVDLILIPTNVGNDDTDIALDWMARFRQRKLKNAKFVLSKIQGLSRKSVIDALPKIEQVGPRLATAIPNREDILFCNDKGLSPIDAPSLKSKAEFESLWNNVKYEING